MTAKLEPPENPAYDGARLIVLRLAEAGHDAVLAGGCVRDLLLGRKPKDYDIATSATPDEVEALFENTRGVGKQFGVCLVTLSGRNYEVATFRTEGPYSDGRHPDSVRFSSARQDAQRRDFTINGIFQNPLTGEILDYVDGRGDLSRGIVRAIGRPEDRFREDRLRIIRAVRFAARLEFEIEPATRDAVRSLAHLACKVAAERLRAEMEAILTERHAGRALRLMDELGILSRLFPELDDTRGCEQPENYHPEGDVFVHTILTVEKLGEERSFELTLAALLHDVGKPEASRRSGPKLFPEHSKIGEQIARRMCGRLRLSGQETEKVCWLVRRHMYFKDARGMKESTLKRLFAEPDFEELAEIYRADTMASWGNLDDYNYVMEKKRSMPPEEVKPPRLITGRDLIEMGYQPGPAFSEVLSTVCDKQLEGEVRDRPAALALARRIAGTLAAKGRIRLQ